MSPRIILLLGAATLLILFRKRLTEAASMAISRTTGDYSDPLRRQIIREEGLKRYAYKDSAGFWTIGIGHKINLPAEQHLLQYTPQNLAPDEVVNSLYELDIADARGAVRQMVKVPLSTNQNAALVSLVFNIGTGAFYKSTLLKLLNAGNYDSAAQEILRWKNAGGRPILLARRQRERELFLTA